MRNPPHRRKALTRLLICIVVGLITSVGVAWLAVATVDASSNGDMEIYATEQSFPRWEYVRHQGNSYVRLISIALDRDYLIGLNRDHFSHSYIVNKGPRWSLIRNKPSIEYMSLAPLVMETAWGWPMVCLVSVFVADQPLLTGTIVSGIPLETGTRRILTDLLPIRPIWRGLVVNTALYAFITWLVIVLLVRVRNSIRRKRGLCIHCRYAVRDLPVCPECGSAVISRVLN